MTEAWRSEQSLIVLLLEQLSTTSKQRRWGMSKIIATFGILIASGYWLIIFWQAIFRLVPVPVFWLPFVFVGGMVGPLIVVIWALNALWLVPQKK